MLLALYTQTTETSTLLACSNLAGYDDGTQISTVIIPGKKWICLMAVLLLQKKI